jgi:hypothetical protein
MRQGVNRLALPYFFTSASPAKFLAYNLGLLTRANPKNCLHGLDEAPC